MIDYLTLKVERSTRCFFCDSKIPKDSTAYARPNLINNVLLSNPPFRVVCSKCFTTLNNLISP